MGLQVSFYSDAADPLRFACRLVRRAFASGKPLGVCVPAAQAAALDELLWSFEAQEFIPHRRWNPAATAEPSEVLLVSDAASLPHRALLLNLGEDMPSAALEFERILEVVGSDAGLVRAGRARYRLYQQAGARLDHFSAAG